jgi:hypothetical protein
LPFLFRDMPFLTRGWKDGFATGFQDSMDICFARQDFKS